MKMCVFLLLVAGCSSDPFVSFHSESPEPDGAASAAPVDEDAGEAQDVGAPEDSGTGGRAAATGGHVGSGGKVTSDGSTGGALVSSGGSAPAGGSGGVVGASGGAMNADAPDGCALVTHVNGFNATWQDCVPLGTYNKKQAMRACNVSGAPECRASNCGPGNLIVCGYNGTRTYGCWGYEGSFAGRAKEGSDSCYEFTATWG